MKKIHFHTGGPFHPTAAQAKRLAEFLGEAYEIVPKEGTAIFDDLDSCDLFVAAALHWTGMGQHLDKPDWWPEEAPLTDYVAPTKAQKEAFRAYVRSGHPILGFHGGVACYDDWPEYGELLGVKWDWPVSNHGLFQDWTVEPLDTGHPVLDGVETYTLKDEIYGNLQITPRLPYTVHAQATVAEMKFPMILTAEGGRIEGAGKTAYLANGHNMQTIKSQTFLRVVRNTINWLLT